MSEAIERNPYCACGGLRNFLDGIYFCPNCDDVTDAQRRGGDRKVTTQDRRYNLTMRQLERDWYPEQFTGAGITFSDLDKRKGNRKGKGND